MKKAYPIPTDTAASQASASDPQNSAWVSANAGSGKTHVLAQRVIRLLLRGTDPSKILCLTYTRAAAANTPHARPSRCGRTTAPRRASRSARRPCGLGCTSHAIAGSARDRDPPPDQQIVISSRRRGGAVHLSNAALGRRPAGTRSGLER